MINGGKHGTKNLDFQEFHLVPSTSKSFSTTLEFAVSAYSGLKNLFTQRNADVSVSEEGGFTPNLFTNTEAFDIIKEVLLSRKLKLGVDIYMGVDCAPEYYYKNRRYAIKAVSYTHLDVYKRQDYTECILQMSYFYEKK